MYANYEILFFQVCDYRLVCEEFHCGTANFLLCSAPLTVLKLNGDNWASSYVMTDYQESKILAIEMVFKGNAFLITIIVICQGILNRIIFKIYRYLNMF